MEKQVRVVVPATPGFSVVELITGNDEFPDELMTTAIVAWIILYDDSEDSHAVDLNQFAIPVTFDETKIDGSPILTPEGNYVIPYDRTFRDQKELIAYLKGRRIARLQK